MRIRLAAAADQEFLWDMLHAAIYVPAGGQPVARELFTPPLGVAFFKDVEPWTCRQHEPN